MATRMHVTECNGRFSVFQHVASVSSPTWEHVPGVPWYATEREAKLALFDLRKSDSNYNAEDYARAIHADMLERSDA